MVDQEKVILMTKLAIYEQDLGREDLEKTKYFKSDYVKYNCLKTLVSTTVMFWLVVACYIYYNMITVLEKMVSMNYIKLAYKVLSAYGLVCIIFVAFAWVLYSYRYAKAKPHIVEYNHNLKKLISYYDREEKLEQRRRNN